MGALVGCWDCGFVTTRHSGIGARGECPHCRGPLDAMPFSAALRMRKGAAAREREGGPREQIRTGPGASGPRVAP